jgi:hypothetical protein
VIRAPAKPNQGLDVSWVEIGLSIASLVPKPMLRIAKEPLAHQLGSAATKGRRRRRRSAFVACD